MKKNLNLINNQLKVGNTVEGEVIKIGKNEIWVDLLDGKATGIIRGRELENELEENKNLKLGEKIKATIIEEENELGIVELSLRQSSHLKVWDQLKEYKENKTTIKVRVIEATRGGVIVSYGKLQGFIPASQLSSSHYPQVEDGNKEKILNLLKELVGKILEVKVIDVDKSQKKLIFSEKEVEVEKKKSIFEKYKVGDVVEGKIVGLSPFGAFFEFDEGLKGLIHISELSWQRIEKIDDVVKVGEKVKAKIISLDESKISLSLKRLTPDPWEGIEKRYQKGKIVKGKVIKITPYGIFIELDKGIQGLAHISEIPEESQKKIEVGKILEFKIISLEPEDRRLSLSLKI